MADGLGWNNLQIEFEVDSCGRDWCRVWNLWDACTCHEIYSCRFTGNAAIMTQGAWERRDFDVVRPEVA